jgi:2-polyprenyl-3-methyl-5-hydroxy-6-metoxy-1,4-benzoquinol methylase
MLPTDPESLERARAEVERASAHYYYGAAQLGIDARSKALFMQRCLEWVEGPRVLDLGFVEGAWTDALLAQGCSVDVVEGASRHVAFGRDKYAGDPRVRMFHALFQEFEPPDTYDTIVAADMIRYLPDPAAFLARARTWLAPSGRIVITVPNRRSLHRRIGAALGFESSLDEPNTRDTEVGNRRSYDRYELRHLLQQCGYDIETLQGAFLKPLSSEQMAGWSDELLRAFLEVGDELQDYAWFIWAAARPSSQSPR